ncbi:hypothetical protein D3C86_1578360 [compost metagenome]
MGGDDRLDQATELVSATTGATGDDDFDVLVRLPGVSKSGKGAGGDQGAAEKQTGGATDECISHDGRASFLCSCNCYERLDCAVKPQAWAECVKVRARRLVKTIHTPIAWGYSSANEQALL